MTHLHIAIQAPLCMEELTILHIRLWNLWVCVWFKFLLNLAVDMLQGTSSLLASYDKSSQQSCKLVYGPHITCPYLIPRTTRGMIMFSYSLAQYPLASLLQPIIPTNILLAKQTLFNLTASPAAWYDSSFQYLLCQIQIIRRIRMDNICGAQYDRCFKIVSAMYPCSQHFDNSDANTYT